MVNLPMVSKSSRPLALRRVAALEATRALHPGVEIHLSMNNSLLNLHQREADVALREFMAQRLQQDPRLAH